MTKKLLKRSQFLLGMVRAWRGLRGDLTVCRWLPARKGKIARYLADHKTRKLHLGASNNVLQGWLNTDITLNQDSVIYLNATQTFPFETGTFDYVMAEHMIEHIDYEAGQFMLRECYRILKPGGSVRFATPDLRVLLGLHAREKSPEQLRYLDWIVARLMPGVTACKDAFVINNAFRAWGHSFLYDRETLELALSSAGFRDIRFYSAGKSDDPNLEGLESHGREIQAEDINQFETMVVEGRK